MWNSMHYAVIKRFQSVCHIVSHDLIVCIFNSVNLFVPKNKNIKKKSTLFLIILRSFQNCEFTTIDYFAQLQAKYKKWENLNR